MPPGLLILFCFPFDKGNEAFSQKPRLELITLNNWIPACAGMEEKTI
jgi:hypothetical protein